MLLRIPFDRPTGESPETELPARQPTERLIVAVAEGLYHRADNFTPADLGRDERQNFRILRFWTMSPSVGRPSFRTFSRLPLSLAVKDFHHDSVRRGGKKNVCNIIFPRSSHQRHKKGLSVNLCRTAQYLTNSLEEMTSFAHLSN